MSRMRNSWIEWSWVPEFKVTPRPVGEAGASAADAAVEAGEVREEPEVARVVRTLGDVAVESTREG